MANEGKDSGILDAAVEMVKALPKDKQVDIIQDAVYHLVKGALSPSESMQLLFNLGSWIALVQRKDGKSIEHMRGLILEGFEVVLDDVIDGLVEKEKGEKSDA